ncbi:MAG TPA: hypothetical protein PLR52_07950 [Bacteroidales bacterium]|nr:hypothetical protein [Bacteroidales bacterium]HPR72688.1 hypothetical protein [Bacteroidales bacterium]
MKKLIFFSIILLLAACKEKTENTYFTPEKAKQNFDRIKAICEEDNGELWGTNLYGPLMYVDRGTRKILANQPDQEGNLKEKNGIYTGNYPNELIINNTANTFGGTLFAMSALPSEENEFRIISRGLHSLYHRHQKASGYFTTSNHECNSPFMEERNARIWTKLEWNALRKAISSEGQEQLLCIRDALVFRGARREFYQDYSAYSDRFETYEGLAFFTSLLLGTESQEEFNTHLTEYLDRVYSFESYSRSYGTVQGTLYATLLYMKGFDFTTIQSENVNLGELVMNVYDIQLPELCRDVAGSLAINYDIDKIREEENQRDADIKEYIHKQINTFVEKPVVYIELESPYFDFNPEDIQPLGPNGTLYHKIRISDNWGKLTVTKGGCLISSNFTYLRVTAKNYKAGRNHYEGEGWDLMLNNNWEVIEVDENYILRKLQP